MPEKFPSYTPSPEEIQKAEEMMTEEQKELSKERSFGQIPLAPPKMSPAQREKEAEYEKNRAEETRLEMKAQGMMTEKQRIQSETREEGYRIAQERVYEAEERLLAKEYIAKASKLPNFDKLSQSVRPEDQKIIDKYDKAFGKGTGTGLSPEEKQAYYGASSRREAFVEELRKEGFSRFQAERVFKGLARRGEGLIQNE